MRTLPGVGLVLALACGAAAQEKKDEKKDAPKLDPAKLVGRWEAVKSKEGEAVTMEFTKDNKLAVTGIVNGSETKIQGTYKLDGDKLTFALKSGDVELRETVTVTKLTDEELVGKDKEGKEEAFRRAKPKK